MPNGDTPTGTMTRQEFARFIKSRVPSLAQFPDDQVIEGVLKRRPDLAGRIKEGFGTRLWEAANKPLGRDVEEETRESISNLASRLPEGVRGPVAFAGNVATAVPMSIVEAGRRMVTSPLGMATAGFGGLMQELRELGILASPAVKAGVSAAETGVSAAFGAKGVETALAPGRKGETPLEEIERRGTGAGQALFGASGVAHATGPTAKVIGKEVSGAIDAPTMDRLIAAKDINALDVKNKTLAPIEKAVHDDAQATLKLAIDRMEAVSPGVAEKTALADQIESAWSEFVKTPESVPEPIKKLLGAGEAAKGVRALSAGELKAAQLASRLLKEGHSVNEVKSAMVNLGYAPKQVDAIVGVASPQADTGWWSATELQQIRSSLGSYAFGSKGKSLPGWSRVASISAYRLLSDILDQAAEKGNATAAWRVGNQKWKTYNETFDGKWEGGSFHDSPLANALRGQTANEIMNALGKDHTQQTRDLLGRYSLFGPDAMAKVNAGLARHNRLSTIETFSHPSKWEATTALVYPFAPHVWEAMAGMRMLTPPMLRLLATRGIRPMNVRGMESVTPGIPQEEPTP